MEDKSVKSVTSNPEYVRPLQALLQACNDRPLASSAMTELRKLFHQWNMDEWPLPPYATRSREDVWILAGDLLRDLRLAAIVDVFSARDPSDDRGTLVAVDSPEPLYFPRGDVTGSQIYELFETAVLCGEGAGRSEKPEVLSLCLRTLERAAPICFLRALAQPPSSMAAWRRHWLSDLESVLHRALPRIRWLDALSRAAVAERLRLLRIDASFIGSPKSAGPCAAADVRVLRAPMAALVEVFRRRPLQSITSWWRRALPLSTWPSLDLPSGYLVRLPPGLINDSVPANGSLLFAFHLARVAVRLYAAMMPILYAGSLYDRSLPLTDMSESRTRTLLACLDLGEWHQWAAPLGSDRDSWLRRWLLDQTLALELALLSFRKLSAADRVWELGHTLREPGRGDLDTAVLRILRS
ncbi:hypothetical protein MRX96_017120 [Rhipicephalus microplus]